MTTHDREENRVEPPRSAQPVGKRKQTSSSMPEVEVCLQEFNSATMQAAKELIRVSNQHRRFVVGSIVGKAALRGEGQAGATGFADDERGPVEAGESSEGWVNGGRELEG